MATEYSNDELSADATGGVSGEDQMLPGEESVPGEETSPGEENDSGDVTQDNSSTQGNGLGASPNSGATADQGQLPPGMSETLKKGAEAMFYTAVQVTNGKRAKELLKKYFAKSNITDASTFVIDQVLKIHKQQDLPITGPMVLAASFWIVQYIASLARSAGAKISNQQAKVKTLEVMDWFLGKYDEYQLYDKYGDAFAKRIGNVPSPNPGDQRGLM